MNLAFLGVAGIRDELDYLKVVQRHGDTTQQAARTTALAELKAPRRFITSCSMEVAKAELDKVLGLAFWILHHGPVTAPMAAAIPSPFAAMTPRAGSSMTLTANSISPMAAGSTRAGGLAGTSTTPLPTPIPAGWRRGPAQAGPEFLQLNAMVVVITQAGLASLLALWSCWVACPAVTLIASDGIALAREGWIGWHGKTGELKGGQGVLSADRNPWVISGAMESLGAA